MARKFGANCSKCQRSTEQQQSIKCFKIHSKDLLQNNDFHITSSIFLLSSVLVFYFFLILFFNSIVFLYCLNFWRLARIFSRLRGLPLPPPPRLVRLCLWPLITHLILINLFTTLSSCPSPSKYCFCLHSVLGPKFASFRG